MYRIICLVAMTIVTCLTAAPSAQAQQTSSSDSSRAVTAARNWLMLVDSARWQVSIDSAADLFRQIVGSAANWQQFATTARSRYPVSGNRVVISWEPNYAAEGAPPGRYARVTFDAGGTRESIVMTLTPNGWRVAMYGVTR